MHFKMWSLKFRPSCLGLDVLVISSVKNDIKCKKGKRPKYDCISNMLNINSYMGCFVSSFWNNWIGTSQSITTSLIVIGICRGGLSLSKGYVTTLQRKRPVEVTSRLDKRPFFNGRLANRRLTTLVKEVTDLSIVVHPMNYVHYCNLALVGFDKIHLYCTVRHYPNVCTYVCVSTLWVGVCYKQ